MGFTNFISEAEAMHVCGVSAKTLSRFAEAGYLSIEKESDGLRLYSSDELEKVFGKSVAAKRPFRRNGALAQKPPISSLNAAPLDAHENSDSVHVDSARVSAADTEVSAAGNVATKPEQVASSEECVAPHSASETETSPQSADTKLNDTHATDTSQKMATKEQASPAQETVHAKSSFNTEGKKDAEELGEQCSQEQCSQEQCSQEQCSQEQCSDEQTEQPPSVREIAPLDERDELIQLRADKAVLERINEVNEKIIELREERIQEVSKERDWLRERVEKLEQKAERDQILLMSETQLLRQVMEQNALQRSPVRKALEWIGLIDPPESPFQSGKERVVLSE